MRSHHLWILTTVYSAAMLCLLLWMWVKEQDTYREQLLGENTVVVDRNEQVWRFLDTFKWTSEPPAEVKTGIYLMGLRFKNATEVGLTGVIWQEYVQDDHDHIADRGFWLPEEVDIGNLVTPNEIFRKVKDGHEHIGWNFDSTVRQKFDYSKFPLDHKVVRVRIWPSAFDVNQVLVPDIDAYLNTGKGEIFGIDVQNIALGQWRIRDTFFSYQVTKYGTDWGVYDQPTAHGFPDLTFNVVLERRFLSAAVIHLVPLMVVLSLLYGMLLLVTNNTKRAEQHGSNIAGFLSGASALFFVVMLAHVQLRETLPMAGFIYLEQFYLVAYLVICASAINVFVFRNQLLTRFKWLYWRDNLVPKLLYWPAILSVFAGITWFFFKDSL
jgi:hypothetical protein